MNTQTVSIPATAVRIGDRVTNITGPVESIDFSEGRFIFRTRFATFTRTPSEVVEIRF